MSSGQLDDTIVALSSGRTPAAIAITRLSGPNAWGAMERLTGSLPRPREAALRTLRLPLTGEPIDQGLVILFTKGASSTGEPVAEFHGHGGKAVAEAVVRAFAALPGMRPAEPGEFTRRALSNGVLDLTQAEGLADLLAAETEVQRRSAITRAGGALRRRIEGLTERVVALSAVAEHAIDYDDEDEGPVPDRREMIEVREAILELLAMPRLEPLRNGVRVVLVGPPNSGKSSLFNAIAKEERAIVTPHAGTTRDSIEAHFAMDGVPIILIDTAGLRQTDDPVEALGVARTRDQVARANLVVWLGPNDPEDLAVPVIPISPQADRLAGIAERLSVSALTGQGVEQLIGRVVEHCRAMLPAGQDLSVDDRAAGLLEAAAQRLLEASSNPDSIIVADHLRVARDELMRITGKVGIEAMLDQLMARFCVGK